MKKTFLPFVWVFLLLFTGSVHALEPDPLYDVGDHVYKEAIWNLYDRQIIYGNDADGSFLADHPINRAEFTTLLMRAFLNEDESILEGFDASCFSDIPAQQWYTQAICYAKNQGFLHGHPDGLFWPGDNINFAEAAKLIVNTLNVSSEQPNTASLEAWYEEFIQTLSEKKAIPPTLTQANQSLTRAEMAELLYRILNEVTDQASTPFEQFKSTSKSDALACIDQKVPASIDMIQVREAWLSWTNQARTELGLPAYRYHNALHYSAQVWSDYNQALGKSSMTHQRPGDKGYYNYKSIKRWFSDLNIHFAGSGTQFTENMTWGPFSCTQADCTEKILEWTKSGFDYFMAEKGKAYTAHYDSLMSPHYEWIGFGLATEAGSSRFYVTLHYAKDISAQPGDFCT